MLARPMPTNGWVNCDALNYQRVGVLPLALSRAPWVISEHKRLWHVRHDLIVPCNTLFNACPFSTRYIRFALNQSTDGYLRLPRGARGRQPASRSE